MQSLAVVAELTARVVDGRLTLADFLEDDPVVVDVVGNEDDPVAATRRCLQIGARAAQAARAGIDSLVVERAFAQLDESFNANLAAAVGQMSSITDELVDDDSGALPGLLRDLQRDLAEQLGALFDPSSKTSALAKLEAVFASAAAGHGRVVGALLDPDDPTTALGRWKAEVLAAVRDHTGAIALQVQELATAVAVDRARAEVYQLTTAKGFSFEEVVHAAVDRLASHHGDLAEAVGRSAGAGGNHAGDELVTLNPADTAGRRATFVFEVKDRKLSRRKLFAELERAVSNREAQAGVAVVARLVQAPGALPLQLFDNLAVVVLDDDLLAERALELAYTWARSVARRSLALAPGAFDIAEVHARLADAFTALSRASTVRRCLSTARNGVDQAHAEMDALVAQVDGALCRLRSASQD